MFVPGMRREGERGQKGFTSMNAELQAAAEPVNEYTLGPTPLTPGSILQKTYRIRHRIAEGGMAMLYLATHERLPGLFVVKTPHPHLSDTEQMTARLRQEAEVLASISHPNIVRVFDFNETPTGTPYMVLEYLDGRDLNDILRTRRLRPWEVAAIVRQIASALGAAHTNNVIHRDLKPENVIVVPGHGHGDVVKLIDFGVSKIWRSARIKSNTGIIGTPHYMSPEQAHGSKVEVDGRTDQFALAIMTYEMLAQETPFAGDDALAVLYRIVNDETPPLGSKVDWSPRNVDATLRRALSKDPADRYASVQDFSAAFDEALRADIGTPQNGVEERGGLQFFTDLAGVSNTANAIGLSGDGAHAVHMPGSGAPPAQARHAIPEISSLDRVRDGVPSTPLSEVPTRPEHADELNYVRHAKAKSLTPTQSMKLIMRGNPARKWVLMAAMVALTAGIGAHFDLDRVATIWGLEFSGRIQQIMNAQARNRGETAKLPGSIATTTSAGTTQDALTVK
jgi:serine/threonine protein kinase